jgi:hypothetical protein
MDKTIESLDLDLNLDGLILTPMEWLEPATARYQMLYLRVYASQGYFAASTLPFGILGSKQ